jgi:hypothetical protein
VAFSTAALASLLEANGDYTAAKLLYERATLESRYFAGRG